MTDSSETYVSPFTTRYASSEMKYNFSDKKRFTTWRRLWFYLAVSQKKLGLDITDEQLKELERNVESVDIPRAAEEEKKTRHDVMAHVHVLAEQCPLAAPVIHLGATSCDIVDNADLLILKDAFEILLPKIGKCISLLKDFASEYRDLPTLGYTHYQPAQLTTVGKRACLWLQDLLISEEAISEMKDNLKFRGIKGTTGTQASFLQLFNGDYEKVKKLDELVTEMAGFKYSYPVTGQTYPRLIDVKIVAALAIFGSAAHKICTDLRLLSNHNEISEPIESTQIGSSAMAYKKNPMRSERTCSIARHLMSLVNNPLSTAAVQWFERTLDDSANRRITLSEAFLAADSVVRTLQNIFEGINVYPAIIARHVEHELPFMATENIIIAVVKHGGDRQECHEKIRCLSFEVSDEMKSGAKDNNLLEKIKKDPYFEKILPDLPSILDVKTFIGCAPQQVCEFLKNHVEPVLEKYKGVSVPRAVIEL